MLFPLQQHKIHRNPEPVASRSTTWGSTPQTRTRSLAEIQREEEQRASYQQDANYVSGKVGWVGRWGGWSEWDGGVGVLSGKVG